MINLLLNESGLCEFSLKINNGDKEENMKILLEEISIFFIYYKNKICVSNNIDIKSNKDNTPIYDENILIKFMFYLCEIFGKLDQINSLSENRSLNSNFNSHETIDYIYLNILNLIINLELVNMIFIHSWKILILNENINLNFIKDRLFKFELLFKFMKRNSFVDFILLIYNKFNNDLVSSIIKEQAGGIKETKMSIIKNFDNFLPYYEKIRYVFNLFFNDKNFSFLNKNKNFFKSIFENISNLTYNLNSNQAIEDAFILLKNKEYQKILNIIRILKNCKLYFDNLFQILLSAFKKLYKNIYSEYLINKNSLIFFEVIKEYEAFLFNEDNTNFFDLDNFYSEFRKIVSEVLNTTNEKPKIFSEAFNLLLRTENNTLLEIIFSYLEILEDYEKFEEFYTFQIIQRSLDEILDKTKESEIVNKIIQRGKDKFVHSFKLQTVINNIKIGNNNLINLVGIPSHCYHLFNYGCKPSISDQYLLDLFESIKLSAKFPTNSRLIIQQGSIEFSFKSGINIINIRCHPLQYSILNFLRNSEKTEDNIINYMEITSELFEFLIDKPINSNLVIKNLNNKFKINFGYVNKNSFLDIYSDLLEFIHGNKTVSKLNERDIKHIIDCYIMKYLKRVKKSDFNKIREEVSNIKFSLFIVENIDDRLVHDRLGFLEEKTLIKKENNDYLYS